MKNKTIIILSIILFSLIFSMMFLNSSTNEKCERKTIGGVVDIGDICKEVQGDEQNDRSRTND